jgi:REP element-mobilizing transposase RayT
MARPLRINAPGLSYHITSRGTDRKFIYVDDDDRGQFLERFRTIAAECDLCCYAYCLMDNHYHLVVMTRLANLSRAMHRLNGPYARWWNDRHGQVGHVFQGRFNAKVIQDGTYLLNACRYTVLNPVRAGMVHQVTDWPWSSYRATAGLTNMPTFLCPDPLLAHFGEGVGAFEAYRRFVGQPEALEERLPDGPIIGDAEFIARFKGLRDGASREVRKADRDTRPPLEEVFAGAVRRDGRDAASARAFAEGYRVAEIAQYLGVSRSGVRLMMGRASASAVAVGMGPDEQKVPLSDLTP